MKKITITVFILILFIFNACSEDSTTEVTLETEKAIELKNVSYGLDSKQNYDIYLPENRTVNTRILLLIHGGGWTSGDKADMNGFYEFVKNEIPDLAIVNMNYRLADNNTAPHPMQVNDISSLVEVIKEKQNEYQISSSLGIMGISAGGHLGLLWSYAHDVDNQVKMVCSMVGPTNLKDDAYQNSTEPVIQELIGLFGKEASTLEEVSPLFQVKSTSPSTLLFYGGQDPLIPISQGIDLDARLTELNVVHEFTLYETEGHGWVGLDLFDTSVKLKEFIIENLL